MNEYVATLQHVPGVVNRFGGPVAVLGRVVGLGQAEVEAGVPWWAWLGVGVVAGSVLTYSLRNKIQQIVEA